MENPKSIMRIGKLSFCHFRDCSSKTGSPSESGIRVEDIRELKKDPMSMSNVRRTVARYDVVTFLSGIDDDGALDAFERLFANKILCHCTTQPLAPSVRIPVRSQAQNKAAEILEKLQEKNRIAFEGQTYVLMRTETWRSLPKDDQYHAVPALEAKKIVTAAANQPITPAARDAWHDSREFFTQAVVSANDSALVLLRIVPKRIFRSPTSETALTPSQLARLMTEKHWVEICLVDEDGVGVEGVQYSIIAPDNNEYTGSTDPEGFARVDNIPAGQCKISFPELDKDTWKPA
jgi:hypothetical protein